MRSRDPWRQRWRALVQASDLPNGVKVTLLTHSQSGGFHDEVANVHGRDREAVASLSGKSERTVQRNFATAVEHGYLLRHSAGHNGYQQTFHYVVPEVAYVCKACTSRESARETSRETEQTIQGDTYCSLGRETPGVSPSKYLENPPTRTTAVGEPTSEAGSPPPLEPGVNPATSTGNGRGFVTQPQEERQARPNAPPADWWAWQGYDK